MKVSLKIDRPFPFTLRTCRALERIQLTVQRLETQSDKCHKENLHFLKVRVILTWSQLEYQ